VVAGLALLAASAAAAQPAETPAGEPYVEAVPGKDLVLEMVPIPAGRLRPGSDPATPERGDDEGPGEEVAIGAFWMSKREISWDVYDAFRLSTAVSDPAGTPGGPGGADAITRPTPPYGDESFGFGKGERPAISMTHHAAMEFTRWLSRQTGRAYRLPTEAEWEYACLAGGEGPWSAGVDTDTLEEHAWYFDNADFRTQPVGGLAPGAWGLLDMHGNVAEWVLDGYRADAWTKDVAGDRMPVVIPGDERYPHVVKGGSWDDDPPELRCAARRASEGGWSRRDPQIPQSIWWHTDATFVGFRVVRAVEEDERLAGLRSEVTEDSP
jgi:formylglycine-generating enzyme required for sulfatase activity